jgi:hypothetical protein
VSELRHEVGDRTAALEEVRRETVAEAVEREPRPLLDAGAGERQVPDLADVAVRRSVPGEEDVLVARRVLPRVLQPQQLAREDRVQNRRTEIWWDLREWIRTDAALAGLPPEKQDLLRCDLCAPKYEQRSDGRIALEGKDKIRDRTGRSPDHGDALALAVAAGRRQSNAWASAIAEAVRRRRDEDDDDPDPIKAERRRWQRRLTGPYADSILNDPFNPRRSRWTPIF